MKQEQKLIGAVVVLAGLVGAGYVVRKDEKKDLDAHTAGTASKDFPKIAVSKEDAKKITKLVIANKDKGEVTLEKKGDKWTVTKPVQAAANQKNVESLLGNFEKLEIAGLITQGSESFEKYELKGKKTVHVQAFKGAEKALDFYIGKNGTRGQMIRVEGTDSVFKAKKGLSSYLYTRAIKDWRDTQILDFKTENAIQVEIENKHAKYSFTKEGGKWASSLYKREDGTLAEKPTEWEKFTGKKVDDMLRAYKSLRATDFGDDKSDAGFDGAATTDGGVVKIKLKDGAGDFTVTVGKVKEGTNRFARKEGGDGTVYVLSDWAAKWAKAEPEMFEETPKADAKGPKKGGDAKADGKGDKGKDAKGKKKGAVKKASAKKNTK